jgi:hypothetical protein
MGLRLGADLERVKSFVDDSGVNMIQLPRIAPNLAKSRIDLIASMNSGGLCRDLQIAIAANYSARAIRRIRTNIY